MSLAPATVEKDNVSSFHTPLPMTSLS